MKSLPKHIMVHNYLDKALIFPKPARTQMSLDGGLANVMSGRSLGCPQVIQTKTIENDVHIHIIIKLATQKHLGSWLHTRNVLGQGEIALDVRTSA